MIYYLNGYEKEYSYMATLQCISLFDIETRLTKNPNNSNPVLIPNIDRTYFNGSEFDDEVVDNVKIRKKYKIKNWFIQFTYIGYKKETLKNKYATILVDSMSELIKYSNIPFSFIPENFYKQIISKPEIKEIKSLLHKLDGVNVKNKTIDRAREITESDCDNINYLKFKLNNKIKVDGIS